MVRTSSKYNRSIQSSGYRQYLCYSSNSESQNNKDKIKININENFTAFIILISFINIYAGYMNLVWLPGEVSLPLKMVGGASAIFLLFAKTYEQKCLSLHSIMINTLTVCCVHSPDSGFILFYEIYIYIYKYIICMMNILIQKICCL